MKTANQEHMSGPDGCHEDCLACRQERGQHTPGPWIVTPTSNPKNGANWRDILSTGGEFPRRYVAEAQEADARLIAAGPDLLESLQLVVANLFESHADEIATDHFGDGPDCSYCRNLTIARAAIARATGGAK